MKNIDGIYKVDLLGPYGWEKFSTAFIQDGKYSSASAEHFTTGTYSIEDCGFEMNGNFTQYDHTRTFFGREDIKDLPIKFTGGIYDDIIDGVAREHKGGKHSLRFRLSKMPSTH